MYDFIRYTKIPESLENAIGNFVAGIEFSEIGEIDADGEYDLFGTIYVERSKEGEKEENPERYETEEYNLTGFPTRDIVKEANLYFLKTNGILVPEELFVNLLDPIIQEYRDIKQERMDERPGLKLVET